VIKIQSVGHFHEKSMKEILVASSLRSSIYVKPPTILSSRQI